MKCFVLIKGDQVHLAEDKKVIKGSEVSTLMEAKEIVERAKEEAKNFHEETQKECEALRELAKKEGFDEGLKQWSDQLAHLESEIASAKSEMQKSLLPLVMVAIKKILGKEIEIHPEVIVDIVATALKPVAQHRKIAIFVRKADLEELEKARPRLKMLFEDLQSLTLSSKEEIAPGSCIIETEKGILNVSLESQMKALEEALASFLKNQESKPLQENQEENPS